MRPYIIDIPREITIFAERKAGILRLKRVLTDAGKFVSYK